MQVPIFYICDGGHNSLPITAAAKKAAVVDLLATFYRLFLYFLRKGDEPS